MCVNLFNLLTRKYSDLGSPFHKLIYSLPSNAAMDAMKLVHKQMSIYNLRRFDYNLQSFSECFFNFDTDLLIFVTATLLLVIIHIKQIFVF